MTNVRRPIHLQLRPSSIALATPSQHNNSSPKALSPTGDSLPSQIIPHLFVGNQEQTNKETLNRLNISYILSLGLLPLISTPATPASSSATATTTTTSPSSHSSATQTNNGISPTSPTTTTTPTTPTNHQSIVQMPPQNSSKDFKIRLRSTGHSETFSNSISRHNHKQSPMDRDENRGFRAVRSIQCKCINIADNSDQLLAKFFDEAHQFVDEARRKKCNILIHCLAGISRSPTIAIAYLMRANSLRLRDAYNLVKECRPQIDPNISFMSQLMIYEKSLEKGKRTQPIVTRGSCTSAAAAASNSIIISPSHSTSPTSLESTQTKLMQTS